MRKLPKYELGSVFTTTPLRSFLSSGDDPVRIPQPVSNVGMGLLPLAAPFTPMTQLPQRELSIKSPYTPKVRRQLTYNPDPRALLSLGVLNTALGALGQRSANAQQQEYLYRNMNNPYAGLLPYNDGRSEGVMYGYSPYRNGGQVKKQWGGEYDNDPFEELFNSLLEDEEMPKKEVEKLQPPTEDQVEAAAEMSSRKAAARALLSDMEEVDEDAEIEPLAEAMGVTPEELEEALNANEPPDNLGSTALPVTDFSGPLPNFGSAPIDVKTIPRNPNAPAIVPLRAKGKIDIKTLKTPAVPAPEYGNVPQEEFVLRFKRGIAEVESRDKKNPYAAKGEGSSAFGKYQILKSTRNTIREKFFPELSKDEFESQYTNSPEFQERVMDAYSSYLLDKYKHPEKAATAFFLGEGRANKYNQYDYHPGGVNATVAGYLTRFREGFTSQFMKGGTYYVNDDDLIALKRAGIKYKILD